MRFVSPRVRSKSTCGGSRVFAEWERSWLCIVCHFVRRCVEFVGPAIVSGCVFDLVEPCPSVLNRKFEEGQVAERHGSSLLHSVYSLNVTWASEKLWGDVCPLRALEVSKCSFIIKMDRVRTDSSVLRPGLCLVHAKFENHVIHDNYSKHILVASTRRVNYRLELLLREVFIPRSLCSHTSYYCIHQNVMGYMSRYLRRSLAHVVAAEPPLQMILL